MFRMGIGYDLHRLEEGRPLIIGGVTIPHEKGSVAHSDGDVLAHAITDALLGALSLGNIGLLFPDTDPQWKGADSLILLAKVYELIRDKGFVLVNVDSVLVAQRPKLNPYVAAIQERLAETLGISPDQVSVKPKTKELVGPEGLEQAVSAQAVVLLQAVTSL